MTRSHHLLLNKIPEFSILDKYVLFEFFKSHHRLTSNPQMAAPA